MDKQTLLVNVFFSSPLLNREYQGDSIQNMPGIINIGDRVVS
jgi:hypothetical protein